MPVARRAMLLACMAAPACSALLGCGWLQPWRQGSICMGSCRGLQVWTPASDQARAQSVALLGCNHVEGIKCHGAVLLATGLLNQWLCEFALQCMGGDEGTSKPPLFLLQAFWYVTRTAHTTKGKEGKRRTGS